MTVRYQTLLRNPLRYVYLVDNKVTPTDAAVESILAETARIATRCQIRRASSVSTIENELRIAFWDRVREEIRHHEELMEVQDANNTQGEAADIQSCIEFGNVAVTC